MTIAELQHAIESKYRVEKQQMQHNATMDYILADLIGRSISRLHSSSNKMPDITEVYPMLFDDEEVKEHKQALKNELSALRFKQYANFHNEKFKGGAGV